MSKNIPLPLQSSCSDCAVRKLAWFEPHANNGHLEDRQNHRSSQSIYQANEHLFHEGDIHHNTYTLKEGWAVCYQQLVDGQRQVINIALPGDLLGYQTDPSTPIDYSVITATECTFCGFTIDSMDKLQLKEFDLSKRLMQIQHNENRACKQNLAIVSQAQAKKKVAYFLNTLIDRLEERGIDVTKDIAFPLSREDMADATGITYIHLSRICVMLKNEKMIVCKNNHLQVINRSKLQKLADIVF